MNSLDGGDDVQRRRLLVGMLGTVGISLLGRQAHAQPPEMQALESLVAQAQRHHAHCRYRELDAVLASALGQARAARTAVSARDAGRVEAAMSTLYRHQTWLLLRRGEDRPAQELAEKAVTTARSAGDLLLEAEAVQMCAVALRRSPDPDQTERAHHLLVDTATSLHRQTGLATAAENAAYAMLLETGAYTAAIAGDRSTALSLHREAADAARARPAGPASVRTPSVVNARYRALYDVSVHRTLGDPGAAIAAAARIRPEAITVVERAVRYYEDVALAYAQWGRRADALEALRAAEQAAPQEILVRPWARTLIVELLHGGPMLPGLREIAGRAGIR